MNRFFLSVLVSLFLLGCNTSEQSTDTPTDYAEIMSAVLESQPNMEDQRSQYLAEYPEEEGAIEALFDYRLCVVPETAGDEGDFNSIKMTEGIEVYGERWEQSKTRSPIPPTVMPNHLRWDSLFSICPNGVLRFGTPEVRGNTATIFVENMSTIHGYGGEMKLRKEAGSWAVVEETNWWQF